VTQPTTEDIQRARDIAQRVLVDPLSCIAHEKHLLLAHAFLAVFEQNAEMDTALQEWTEQQPEPVSEDVLTTFLYDTAHANLLDIDNDTPGVLALELRRNYVITPKPETKDQAVGAVPDDPAHVDGALDRIAGHALAGAYLDQNGGAV
jgi:hypothetical protein